MNVRGSLRRALHGVVPAFALRRRTARVFGRIFAANGWGDLETVSGPGSARAHTEVFRGDLEALLGELGVRSLLDAGCGDGNWVHTLRRAPERYVGVEVVPELVDANRRRHAGPGREFRCLDLVRDPLPAVDLILCRDALVHLPNAEVRRALRNFRRSGSRWLLATTFTARTENADVPIGGWRPVNLEAPPFSLPSPLRLVAERCAEEDGDYADKALGLWELEAVTLR